LDPNSKKIYFNSNLTTESGGAMTRKYILEVVKGDKVIQVPEESNISSQRIQEAKWDLMRGRMTSDAQEVAKYKLIATNPNDLLKGKNK